MKIRIVEITEWEVDTQMISGDISHMGGSYHREVADAEEEIERLNQEGGKGLPYETEAEDKYAALENYNADNYEYAYTKACDCEYDVFNEETGEWERGE